MYRFFKNLITTKYDYILMNQDFYDEFMILAAKIVKSPSYNIEYKAAKKYIKQFWPGFLSRENLTFIQQDTECPICLEHIKNDELLIKSCGHKFHKKCITVCMLHRYNKCPVCNE